MKKMQKKVVVLGTGGTIAGTALTAGENLGYRAAQLPIAALLDSVPGLDIALGSWDLEFNQIMQLDSKDLGPDHWRLMVSHVHAELARSEVGAVVVTHGTDTMEETAYFLSQVLPVQFINMKPVILTGAMRPANALTADGPQNLRDAIALCRDQRAKGVLVTFAGVVHSAQSVQKAQPYRIDAFDSGEAGPLAVVEEGLVRWLHTCPVMDASTTPFPLERLQAPVWPRVDLLTNYACATGDMVRALARAPLPGDQPVQGIVVAGTGNGTIHQGMEDALMMAQEQGIRVLRSSRCVSGRIVLGSTPSDGIEISAAPTAIKARIALMLELMRL